MYEVAPKPWTTLSILCVGEFCLFRFHNTILQSHQPQDVECFERNNTYNLFMSSTLLWSLINFNVIHRNTHFRPNTGYISLIIWKFQGLGYVRLPFVVITLESKRLVMRSKYCAQCLHTCEVRRWSTLRISSSILQQCATPKL